MISKVIVPIIINSHRHHHNSTPQGNAITALILIVLIVGTVLWMYGFMWEFEERHTTIRTVKKISNYTGIGLLATLLLLFLIGLILTVIQGLS